jgi:hypothetical protein
MSPEELEETYTELLKDYLFGGDDEAALYEAYEFSRRCIREKIGLEEITAVHIDSLGKLTKKVPFQEIPLLISKSSVFFLEFIMNFSLMYKEYFEMWQSLGEQLQDAIRQVGDALVACLNLKDTLKIISSLMRKTTGADAVIIYLLENSHLTPVETENILTKTLPKQTSLQDTLAGLAIKDASIKVALTQEDVKKYQFQKIKKGAKPSSALAVPLIGENRVIGAVECYYEIPYPITEVDNDILLDIANRAARSIENIYNQKGCTSHKDLLTLEDAAHRCKIARRVVLGEGREGYCLADKTCKGLQGLMKHLDTIKPEEVKWVVQWIEYLGDFELATLIKANPDNFKQIIKNRYEELKNFV